MRTLNKYIVQDFLVIFALTLAIITFVMSVGAVLKAVDLVARGASVTAITRVFLYNMPYALTFSIPMSALTSVLLLFSRLSIDGEITAMRASGISLWEIAAPIVIVSIFLSAICAYISSSVAPDLRYRMRSLIIEIGGENPEEMIESGRWIRDFPGYTIYLGDRTGNRFEDITIFKVSPSGIEQSIRAKTGTVNVDRDTNTFHIDLYDVHIEQIGGRSDGDPGDFVSGVAQHYPVDIPLDELVSRARAERRRQEFSVSELLERARDMGAFYPGQESEWKERTRIEFVVEASERMALSFACFAFVLLGFPLGITSRRKESSIGIGISIGLVFAFYFFIVLAKALVDHPQWYPELVIWTPVILGQIAGFVMIKRIM